MANIRFLSAISIFLVGVISPKTVLGMDGCQLLDYLIPILLPNDPLIPKLEKPVPLNITLAPILLLQGEVSELEVAGVHGLKPYLALRLDEETNIYRLAINITDETLVIKFKYSATGYIQIPPILKPLLPAIPSGDLVGNEYGTLTISNLVFQLLSNNASMSDTGLPSRLDNVTRMNVEFGKLTLQFDNLLVGGNPVEWEKITDFISFLWKFVWGMLEKDVTKVVIDAVNKILGGGGGGGEEYNRLRILAEDEPICLEDTFPGAFPPEPEPTDPTDPTDPTTAPTTAPTGGSTNPTTTGSTPESTTGIGVKAIVNVRYFLPLVILSIFFEL